jgi:hypothetical protein
MKKVGDSGKVKSLVSSQRKNGARGASVPVSANRITGDRNLLLTAFCNKLFFSFSGWGETDCESTWYVGHCWPIVPATDGR